MSSKRRDPAAPKPMDGRIERHVYPLPLTIGVLSDTHIFGAGGPRQLSDDVVDFFRRFQVDLVVHGGDIVVQEVLDHLSTVAPTLAVHGNNEPLSLWQELPERIVLEVGPHRIGVVHGHGGASARATSKTAFEEPVDVVIYGHSHIPLIEEVDGVVYFNPGSPTDRRWSRHFGIGVLTIDDRGVRPELVLFESAAHLASIEPRPSAGANE